MQIDSILTPNRTLCDVPGSSKKRVLENIAGLISENSPSLNAGQLFDSLIARERLGSTGLGNGIAIPHCRLDDCNAVIGSLIKLAQPMDFDAMDNQLVDLLFVLLVPSKAQDEHLNVLATLAERFSNTEFNQRLRAAKDNQSLYEAAIS
jgi:PTS system nitrogen regulatory IIA component